METKRFCFSGNIQGHQKDFIVKAPVENGGVYTNKYCPQDLLTGGVSFIKAVNGEVISEFIADCQKQVIAMSTAGVNETRLDTHIAGLMAVVMDHLARCGRLIFGDLLIYMDCFSLLLEADDFSDEEIREIYPSVTRTIVELYPDYIFNTSDLSPFKGSHFDFVLFNVSHK
ncbi:MAG: hypothetical protein PUD39_05030 [Bacteroidales bacterium]|nr:hypothetical protein [Bacteroidales bacterium]